MYHLFPPGAGIAHRGIFFFAATQSAGIIILLHSQVIKELACIQTELQAKTVALRHIGPCLWNCMGEFWAVHITYHPDIQKGGRTDELPIYAVLLKEVACCSCTINHRSDQPCPQFLTLPLSCKQIDFTDPGSLFYHHRCLPPSPLPLSQKDLILSQKIQTTRPKAINDIPKRGFSEKR